jgi:AcrR family transcriptional regulator
MHTGRRADRPPRLCRVAEVRGRRGPYKKSLVRQRQIAEAVLAIVDESGYENVTTAGVAARVGIPEPSVLYHFPTKDHLLVAALRLSDDEIAVVTGADGEQVDLDLDLMRSRGLGDQWANPHRARLDTLLRSLALTPGHPAREFIAERNRRALRVWSGIVERRQRDGLADPLLDPEEVAWQIIAVLEGFSAFTLAPPGGDRPAPRTGDLLADAVLRLTGSPRA